MKFAWLADHRGNAGDAEAALKTDPREMVSRPAYLGRDGRPLPNLKRWEMPRQNVEGCSVREFRKYIAEQSLFVVGGFQFIVELGLRAQWYNNDATRNDAKILIHERKWGKILEELKGKENNANDLFGKKAINEFFATCPPVKRGDDIEGPAIAQLPADAGQRQFAIRLRHPLRLRKAIEFIIITEAILRYRFSKARTLDRFSRLTGLAPNSAYPEVVWDYLWIEPALYRVSVLTAPEHVVDIMNRHELVTRFTQQSGQLPGALYWILKGAPGKWRTVSAACEVLNSVFSEGMTQAAPMTVLPNEYRSRIGLLKPRAIPDYQRQPEYIPELGPERVAREEP